MPIHDWSRVHACIFHDFHHSWVVEISRALNRGVLPGDYYSLIQKITRDVAPDVLILDNARFTAAAEAELYARRRNRIGIHQNSDDRVVAVIEIVPPASKISQQTMRSFAEDALELMNAGIHLLILDVVAPEPADPQGIHAAIWSEISENDFRLPPDKPLTLVAYAAREGKEAYVEPLAVGDALPEMPLFLKPDCYVAVPLEATYRAAYDEVPRRWQRVLERPQP